MKCPCCEQETDQVAIVRGTELWLDDGRVIIGRLGVMDILADLIRHGIVPARNNVMASQVSTLRKFLRSNRVPLGVVTRKKEGLYKLRRLNPHEPPPEKFELRPRASPVRRLRTGPDLPEVREESSGQQDD